MICEWCRLGADKNTEANEWSLLWEIEKSRVAREEAIEYHAKCPGKSLCVCGHGVGVYINQAKIKKP